MLLFLKFMTQHWNGPRSLGPSNVVWKIRWTWSMEVKSNANLCSDPKICAGKGQQRGKRHLCRGNCGSVGLYLGHVDLCEQSMGAFSFLPSDLCSANVILPCSFKWALMALSFLEPWFWGLYNPFYKTQWRTLLTSWPRSALGRRGSLLGHGFPEHTAGVGRRSWDSHVTGAGQQSKKGTDNNREEMLPGGFRTDLQRTQSGL